MCGAAVLGVVPKALLPEANGRDVYQPIEVNGRAVCLSARCVLVCCCTAGTRALSHLAGTALPTLVCGHTTSMGPNAPRVLCCTVSTLSAVPRCLVLCSTLHCVCLAALNLWAVGSGQQNFREPTAFLLAGSGHWSCCFAPPHRLEAVGGGARAIYYHTACWQWAVEILQRTASLPGGSGQWNSCNALSHCLRARASGTAAWHYHTAWAQWAVELLSCTALLPGVIGFAIRAIHCPHRQGVVGSASSAIHCRTTLWQWAVQLLQYTAALLGGSGQWSCYQALPHCLGGSG